MGTRKYKARKLHVAMRRVEVARLYHQLTRQKHPRPQTEIARQLGVSNATICTDLTALEIEWREARIDERDKQKQEMLKRLDWIETEARTEWERSKAEEQSTVVEQEVIEQRDAKGNVQRVPSARATVRKTTRGKTGLQAYLETLRGIEADRRKILGLDAPSKAEVVNIDLSDWNVDELMRLEKGEPVAAVLPSVQARLQREAGHAA